MSDICDREWTPEEDALLNDLSGCVTGELNGLIDNSYVNNAPDFFPITMDMLISAYENFRQEGRGIHITKIVPPKNGWPMAFYCPICRETTFLLSPWAAKPADGDYHKMTHMCASPEFCLDHNIELMNQLRPMIEILPTRNKSLVYWGDEAI